MWFHVHFIIKNKLYKSTFGTHSIKESINHASKITLHLFIRDKSKITEHKSITLFTFNLSSTQRHNSSFSTNDSHPHAVTKEKNEVAEVKNLEKKKKHTENWYMFFPPHQIWKVLLLASIHDSFVLWFWVSIWCDSFSIRFHSMSNMNDEDFDSVPMQFSSNQRYHVTQITENGSIFLLRSYFILLAQLT